jgi:DNA-binding CsgD family transcriptional regulator
MMSTSDLTSDSRPNTRPGAAGGAPTPERTRALHWARQALDLVDAGVVWLDEGGRPLLVNDAAERLLGARIVHEAGGTRFAPSVTITLDDRARLPWRDRAPSGEHVPVTLTDHRGNHVRGRMTMGSLAVAGSAEQVMAITLAVTAAVVDDRQPTAAALASRGLTAREIEVIDLLLLGHRVTTIASMLFVSPHTVRNRLKSIFPKLGVHSQVELVRLARGMHGGN